MAQKSSDRFTNPYDRIIENMRRHPNDNPMKDEKVSEAFREYIKFIFTHV